MNRLMAVVVFAVIMLSGCVHIRRKSLYMDLYDPNKNAYTEVRQCKLPIYVRYSDGLTLEQITSIRNGLRFWESNAGQRLFQENPTEATVIFKYDETIDYSRASKEEILYDKNGCIRWSTITLTPNAETLTNWQYDFLIRHSIGHSLGFDNSDNKIRTMNTNIHRFGNPEVLSDGEIEALKKHY